MEKNVKSSCTIPAMPRKNRCRGILYSNSDNQLSANDASCEIKGDSYPVNSSFITSDCSMQCYCTMSGVASCMELCPRRPPIECPPEQPLRRKKNQSVQEGSVALA
ncbi:hypothetical protein OS493_030741 [Desmophyllum pertusum]|uniref:VWFC domain-containing protein n=1 Tax=Desmophyllum pertusum TaxID=174260 RepID=A0A9X0CVI3_9CNID|nr:hypothetical protein OS493_030741 [Desmophyllum pertusum]